MNLFSSTNPTKFVFQMLFELQLLKLDDFMYLFEWGWDICVFLLTLWDLHVRVMEGHVFWMRVSLDPMKQMTLKKKSF